MPSSLTNAPATFQHLVNTLIDSEMEPHVFAYMDDIIIVTETFEEHLERLSKVLKKIEDANLNSNSAKCQFCYSQGKYLGCLVNKKGLLVDPDKIAPIHEYPVPNNVKEWRRSLG